MASRLLRVVTALLATVGLVGSAAPALAAVPMEVGPPVAVAGVSYDHDYDYRPDFARPPPIDAALAAYDSATNSVDPAEDLGRIRRVAAGSEVRGVAPRSIPTTHTPYQVHINPITRHDGYRHVGLREWYRDGGWRRPEQPSVLAKLG